MEWIAFEDKYPDDGKLINIALDRGFKHEGLYIYRFGYWCCRRGLVDIHHKVIEGEGRPALDRFRSEEPVGEITVLKITNWVEKHGC